MASPNGPLPSQLSCVKNSFKSFEFYYDQGGGGGTTQHCWPIEHRPWIFFSPKSPRAWSYLKKSMKIGGCVHSKLLTVAESNEAGTMSDSYARVRASSQALRMLTCRQRHARCHEITLKWVVGPREGCRVISEET